MVIVKVEKLKKRELLTYLSWREAYGNKIKHGHWDFTRGRMFMSCLRDVSREFWGNMPDSRGLGGTGQWGSGTLRTPFLYWRCIGPLRILTYWWHCGHHGDRCTWHKWVWNRTAQRQVNKYSGLDWTTHRAETPDVCCISYILLHNPQIRSGGDLHAIWGNALCHHIFV